MRLHQKIRKRKKEAISLMQEGSLKAYIKKLLELEQLKAQTSKGLIFSDATLN